MRVRIFPDFNFAQDKGEGGIKQVVKALHRWLPEYGVEIVQEMRHADLLNLHADDIRTDLPIAASSHGLYWEGYEWPRWAIEANSRLIDVMKRADSTSVPSHFVHNAFARGMLLNPHVLQHGVELEEWEPGTNYGYVFWGKNRVDPICTPEPLNKLARLCPKIKFLSTFGDPDVRNITLTGAVPFDRSRSFIRGAAVYLATVCETGGITVLETAAAGVPSLGFRWGANPEIILHKETGYLVDPGDYESLREGLYYCLENRDRLGAAAREFVRGNHQWKDRVADYLPFYQEALDRSVHTGPTVSVIITAYKLEKYLPAAIESVLNQDYDDWECIIVDDASPDRCGEIADGYAGRDSRIKVIHNTTNQYLAQARNTGIAYASGKYILPLDADDMVGDDALGILAGALDTNQGIDIATGKFELIRPDNSRFVSGWPPEDPSFNRQIRHLNQLPYSSLYRKKWWERTGGYRRRWKTTEDADNWVRMMSYGAVPAHVTQKVSLVYNIRPDSMSHSNAEPDWTAWFPWSRYPQFTPFGASGTLEEGQTARSVLSYNPVLVSVIIPCGPGHDVYLQDSIDSVIAQTFQNWEIIVVNDTGERWFDDGKRLINPYLRGYPFVRFVDSDVSPDRRGTAAARNKGIERSKADRFVLLDADDYFQPLALDILYKTHRQFGGWAYTDWYDQEGTLKTAEDFEFEQALIKMPGPSTGIYSKADWELVGGFCEDGLLWEDWSYQLSLMEKSICGVHIQFPCFTYRYDRGQRREDAHAQHDRALAQIKKKHAGLMRGECE